MQNNQQQATKKTNENHNEENEYCSRERYPFITMVKVRMTG